jgi:hypothetical protein
VILISLVSRRSLKIYGFSEKRTLKSTFGKVDEKIDNYRTNLLRLRDNFLSHGAVIAQAVVLDAGE